MGNPTSGPMLATLLDLDTLRREIRAAVREVLAETGPDDPWLDSGATAELLNVSRRTVQLWAARTHDPLPAHGTGRLRRFRRSEVEAWFARQGRVGA